MNILFCSDDKYASKLAVAISSLLECNGKVKDQLNIIIRTNDMTEQTKKRLQKIAADYDLDQGQLHFVYTDELCARLEKEHVKKFKNSYLCYFKLFGLTELLNDCQERLLVIDCDVLICDLLTELYNYDLKGKPVGAVREFPTNRVKYGQNKKGEYNTGVLLYDMEKYSILQIEKKMKDIIETIPDEQWKTGDQTVFTLSLEQADLVETLPLKYNFIMNQTYFSYKEFAYIRNISDNYYCESEYEQAREHPCIIHLISGEFVVSPWYYEGNRSIKNIWDKYLLETDWRDEENGVYTHLPMKSRIRSYICRAIHYCLPHNVSMRIFKMIYYGKG